jgi:heptosyltransferase-1
MKIAIVKLSALGDIVHAMVVLQFIKKYNQAIEIDWFVEEGYKELLDSHPDINKVISVNIKEAKKKKSLYLLYKELKRVKQFGPYDIVIDMQSLVKSAIISRLTPSKITLGFDRSSARENLASIFYNKAFKFSYDNNVIERNFELLKFALDFSFKLQDLNHKLPFLYSDQKHLNTHLSSVKKNIILIPGASFSSKRYPSENFAEFTNLLDANYLVIWGSEEEKFLANKIKHLSSRVVICEKLSIKALISLISQIDLVIGPDTGPTHMAWALNKPSITLFGSTPGYRNSYVTKINRNIESKSKINPYKIDKNDNSIKYIDVREIAKISRELLNR